MNELETYVADRLRDLIADLKSGDDDLAWEAAADLVPMGPAAERAVAALIEVLLDRRIAAFNFYARGMAADWRSARLAPRPRTRFLPCSNARGPNPNFPKRGAGYDSGRRRRFSESAAMSWSHGGWRAS